MRIGLALVVLAAAATAAAAPRDDAKRLKDLGAVAFAHGDPAAALEYFERAYSVFPSPNLLYNLGLAHDALGHVVQAIGAYEDFVAHAPDAPAAALAHARERLYELDGRIGRINITVVPPDADVEVDGARWTAGETVRLLAGAHHVSARRTGYRALALEVQVAARSVQPVALRLEALPAVPAAPVAVLPAAPPAAAPRGNAGRKLEIGGLVVGLVGVAALAAGVGVAVDAQAAQSDILKQYDAARERAGRNDQLAAEVLLPVGGVAVVAGAVLAIVGYRQARRARMAIAPSAGSHGAGLTLRAEF